MPWALFPVRYLHGVVGVEHRWKLHLCGVGAREHACGMPVLSLNLRRFFYQLAVISEHLWFINATVPPWWGRWCYLYGGIVSTKCKAEMPVRSQIVNLVACSKNTVWYTKNWAVPWIQVDSSELKVKDRCSWAWFEAWTHGALKVPKWNKIGTCSGIIN